MKTTLNQIREHEPCVDGWQKLLQYLGKTTADDEPLSLVTILDSNGLNDALWCLRAVEGHEKEIRLYAIWCARQVQHLMKDQRSLDALDIAEKFACGKATQEELVAAADAADANIAWNSASIARDAWSAALYAVNAAADAADADDVTRTAANAAWAAAAADAAANATWDAAWRAARGEQEKKFREMFGE